MKRSTALIALAAAAATAAGTVMPVLAEEAPSIAYLVNGSLGDKGLFDSAAGGLDTLADELGAEVKIIEMGRDETSYEGNFLDVSEANWDYIICGTWGVKELVEEISVEYPEQNYIFFDGDIDFDVAEEGNLVGINYYANQGAFMAGCLSAKMFEAEDEKIDVSQKIVGFIGSMDAPVINDFLIGYIQGLQYVDPEIRVMASYVGSYEDVSKCMEMTAQLYNQGAQIVYAPASQSILGAATAAKDADKYLIACDQDLYGQLVDSDAELAANVLSSSLKNVGQSLYTTIIGLTDGSMEVGQNYTLGLESGAVGLAKNANYEAIVPEAIRAELDEIEGKVIAGEIEINSAFGMGTDEIAEVRDGMKP